MAIASATISGVKVFKTLIQQHKKVLLQPPSIAVVQAALAGASRVKNVAIKSVPIVAVKVSQVYQI